MGRPNRLRRLAAAPTRWPVRWRLTAVSAGLTLVILVCFAVVVGRLASERLRSDFESELRGTAGELAFQIQLERADPLSPVRYEGPQLEQVAMANDASVRLVFGNGKPLRETPGAPALGPPRVGMTQVGDYEVATLPVNAVGLPPAYVQYAQSEDELDDTVNRLWLFLAGGVAGGTLLATLAGLAVAGRAMRPIVALTDATRQVASTRDPSRSLPQPRGEDEIAELARTLEQMLRELDAARAETQAMIQAQREFVADASHELRTPLTSILANLELLQERLDARPPTEGDEHEMVASALRSSRRMRRLVADLLMLARADAGRLGPRRLVDLGQVARAAVGEVEPVAAGHPIELRADAPVPVMGNPDELHRLVVNLLDNGVRHTPAGIRIRIRVAANGAGASLEVCDAGPGIPSELRDQVFSRFVSGHGPADISGDRGTGLGLAIVRAVARSHGGEVDSGESRDGGARFTVRLPLAGEAVVEPIES